MANVGLNMLGAFAWGNPGEQAAKDAGGVDKVFGTKPRVADFIPIDLLTEAGRATDANLSNADKIEALLNRIVPGFSDMLTKGSKNTLALLSGEIPQDVQEKVYRDSAFKSLSGGFAGSGMSRALTARDIGRTSLDLMAAGANSAQMWSGMAEKAYSPFTITAMQQAGATAANNAGQQATQQYKYNVEAAPDPGAAGIYNMNAAIGGQFLSFGMASLGGMGGGGGGGIGNAAVQSTAQGQPRYQYDPATGRFNPVQQGGAWGY